MKTECLSFILKPTRMSAVCLAYVLIAVDLDHNTIETSGQVVWNDISLLMLYLINRAPQACYMIKWYG